MTVSEFDLVAKSYNALMNDNLAMIGGDNPYYSQRKVEILSRIVPGRQPCILDFGCGIGRLLPHLRTAFPTASISCYDQSKDSVSVAVSSNPSVCPIDDLEMASSAGRFDLILISCVMHHIPPECRHDVIRRLSRLLSPVGRIALFEHNPINPLTRRMVATCPFDKNASLLYSWEAKRLFKQCGLQQTHFCYYLLFPAPLRFFRRLEKIFSSIPLGGQYFSLFRPCGQT